MEPRLSQDSLSSLIPPPEVSQPTTPEPPHATIPQGEAAAVSKMQASRVPNATSHMTPPPSSQVPSSQRAKTRTPTPTVSHISTPPPTIELPSQAQNVRPFGGFASIMTNEQIPHASPEEMRTKFKELQTAFQEAKMSAAHHKLQYQMLAQESAAAIERMGVEARMAQFENEVLHVAEQAKVAATPVQPSPFQEGMIPVHKDLYQRMCREVQSLTEERNYLINESAQKEKIMMRQDAEIASLDDKVMLLRDRIRENREQMRRLRRGLDDSRIDSTPHSIYNDPLRSGVSSQEQPQPFAALLQASEMASQEARRPLGKKGHIRNTHSTSSLPSTPHRMYGSQPLYSTPQGRQAPLKIPSTAPAPRTSAMRMPDVYNQHSLPVSQIPAAPPSEGTVSAPDDDSEAETDIIDQDETDAITESQASRAASQMLRSSQERQAKRDSFKGSGMLSSGSEKMKQTKLFGAVRKANVDRGDERPTKRARTGEAVGLGIAGVRQ